VAAGSAEPSVHELWRTVGFDRPESVVVDTDSGHLFVSNVVGSPNSVDGDGFISMLGMDGTIIDLHWLGGFDGPKGMAIVGKTLYVADIKKIYVIDLTSRERLTFEVDGAVALNDVAAADDDGSVFVTDVATNSIFRLSDGQTKIWMQDARLNMPNGITIDGQRMLIASWGGPEATSAGGLLSIDMATRSISPVLGAESVGNLDGVIRKSTGIYFTDNTRGQLLRVHTKGSVEVIATLGQGSADLSGEKDMVFLPILQSNAVVGIRIVDED
jgi:hypothetical protein